MVAIELTADMAAKVYATMRRNLAVARPRLRRPLTLADKVLLGHLDDPADAGLGARRRAILMLRPDRVVFQDVLGQSGMLQFMQTRRQRVAVPTTIHCDHLIQARVEGAAGSARVARGEHARSTTSCVRPRRNSAWASGSPAPESSTRSCWRTTPFPGELIIGTDSHTPNAGGLGACAVGVGGADAVEVIAGLPWELLYPQAHRRLPDRQLDGWTAPKDVILYVAGQLTVSGGTNAIVEYIGPGARTISATGKATITNMGAELGATTSIFPADERMASYLRRPDAPFWCRWSSSITHLLEPDAEVEADPEQLYDRVLRLDLSHARAARRRPAFARPRAPASQSSQPRSPTRSNGFIDADFGGSDRQLHQLVL